MSSSEPIALYDMTLDNPRQQSKVKHDLAEVLMVITCGLLVGADTLVDTEAWAQERILIGSRKL